MAGRQGGPVSETGVRIVPAGSGRDAYVPLLLLADDSESAVRGYYQNGDLYALHDESCQPIATILALPRPDRSVELKAVAVAVAWQGQGIGQRLLAAVLEDLRARGVRRVVVGTGNASIGPLAYYQKAGFRLRAIERDYFSSGRGYPEGLIENGIPLRDMVWMDQEL